MKKLVLTIATIALAASAAFAQNMAEITEIAKQGKEALDNGDKVEAVNLLTKALEMAETEEDEASIDIVATCKNMIPKIQLSIAKELFNAGDFDAAAAKFKEAADIAEKFEEYETADNALALIPQALLKKANTLLNAKDYAAAAEAYKAVLEVKPNDGTTLLRLGQALNAAGNVDEALEAFALASENGQKVQVDKQLTSIFLKKAQAALNAKDYTAAVAAANKVNEIAPNANAFYLAASASQRAGKNNDAIGYFEKFLEVAPNDSKAGQISFTLGALYQQANNKAKAKEFYQKAMSDPKVGADAKKYFDALK